MEVAIDGYIDYNTYQRLNLDTYIIKASVSRTIIVINSLLQEVDMTVTGLTFTRYIKFEFLTEIISNFS
jgi:hypothetical protein